MKCDDAHFNAYEYACISYCNTKCILRHKKNCKDKPIVMILIIQQRTLLKGKLKGWRTKKQQRTKKKQNFTKEIKHVKKSCDK